MRDGDLTVLNDETTIPNASSFGQYAWRTGAFLGVATLGTASILLLQVIGTASFWGSTDALGIRNETNREDYTKAQFGLFGIGGAIALNKLVHDYRNESEKTELATKRSHYSAQTGILNSTYAFFDGFNRAAVNPGGGTHAIFSKSNDDRQQNSYQMI